MSKRVNFTADRVAGFRCDEGRKQSIFWDGKAPGLGLRVTSAGSKSYVFETQLHGKTLRTTIGDVRTWTIGKAQAEATRLKTLTDQGIDPRQQKAEQRAKVEAARVEAARQEVTMGEAWAAYTEARTPKWGDRHRQANRAVIKEGAPLHPFLALHLREITAKRIAAWLDDETARRPAYAGQAFRLLRTFINWCAEREDFSGVVADACKGKEVRENVPAIQSRADCLQHEQLPAWFAAVRSINNPVVSAYLQSLLLTGARREELAGLKWEDADFQWKSITIQDKVEGRRVIPLTPFVASLLVALPRRNEWVFSSLTAESGRLQEVRLQHNKALAVAGIDHLTLHGLRRSFGTLSEWLECPVGVVAQIMGYKPSATAEKHYKVRPLDLLRMWHTKIEAWILEQAGIELDTA